MDVSPISPFHNEQFKNYLNNHKEKPIKWITRRKTSLLSSFSTVSKSPLLGKNAKEFLEIE
jgi:hypothetical protein